MRARRSNQKNDIIAKIIHSTSPPHSAPRHDGAESSVCMQTNRSLCTWRPLGMKSARQYSSRSLLGVYATCFSLLLRICIVLLHSPLNGRIQTSAAFRQPFTRDASLRSRACERRALSANQRPRQSPLDDSPGEKMQNVVSTNFWRTVVRRDEGDNNASDRMGGGIVLPRGAKEHLSTQRRIRIPSMPCVPSLDSDGPLPPGAYFQTSPDAKPTSRIQIAWDVADLPRLDAEVTSRDIAAMVVTMQGALDTGMTTFQLKAGAQRRWAETHLFAPLIRDTPASVLRHGHLIVPLYLQDATNGSVTRGSTVSPRSVRSAVLESLGRTGSNSADNVQIQFLVETPVSTPNENGRNRLDDSSYYLDLLDGLQELQRDGLVMSVSARNMPEQFVRRAQAAGFGEMIVTNQVDANVLDTSALRHPAGIPHRCSGPSSGEAPFTVVAGALAGGWLTDRYMDANPRQPPTAAWLRSLSLQERCNWENDVAQSWSMAHVKGERKASFRPLWEAYHTRLLLPLQEIARKHNVSVASVVLRWTLQLEDVAGTVVACRLLPEQHYWDRQSRGTSRARQLREVVSFELDSEDMGRIWELSGRREEKPRPGMNEHDGLASNGRRAGSYDGLFIPRRNYC